MNPEPAPQPTTQPVQIQPGIPLTSQQIQQARTGLGFTNAGTAQGSVYANWNTLTPAQRLSGIGLNPDGTQIESPTPDTASVPVPASPSLPQRLATDTEGHAGDIVEDLSQKPSLSGALDVAGNVAGEANDIVGEPLKSLYATNVPQPIQDAVSGAVKSIAGTPEAKAVLDAWNNLTAQHPEAAKNIGNIVNIAGLMGMGAGEAPATDATREGLTSLQEGSAAAKTAMDATDNAKTAATAGAKSDAFVKDLVTPEMTSKDMTAAIKTGKVTEGAGLTGERDVTGAVKGFDKTVSAVKEVPGISPKNTLLENANAIHDHIGTIANDLTSKLQAADAADASKGLPDLKEPFTTYMQGVKSSLSENPMLVGDAEKTAGKILDKFTSLVDENGYTREGILNARKGLDTWMASQKGGSVFDPAKESAVSTALRAIRQGGNGFIADNTPDVAVKDMLGKQTSLYNAVESIAPKAAKEGSNGLQQWIKANPIKAGLIKKGAYAVGGAGAYEVAKDLGVPLP